MNKKKKGGLVPFILGIVAALIFGWNIFPQLLFSNKEQPITFSHVGHMTHTQKDLKDLDDCVDCHDYREDGSYAGIPSLESCAECHSEPLTAVPSEQLFVNEYVKKGKQVPWKIYREQPDNVYFSHIAHEKYECTECHQDMENADSLPPYYENKLTGYSRGTMKMWECERCHAEEDASNACYICHK